MVGEHVGDVYFSIWRGPEPRKVKKWQFLPFFFIEKRYIHRKSQFLTANRPNSSGIEVFNGGESIARCGKGRGMTPLSTQCLDSKNLFAITNPITIIFATTKILQQKYTKKISYNKNRYNKFLFKSNKH